MASVKHLFDRHSDSPGGISSAHEWRAFESDVVGFGLGSVAMGRLLSQAWAQARAAGRPVAYLDFINLAMMYSSDTDADKIVQDLRQDASALKRFVDTVRGRYKRDSTERRTLETGLEDVADSYRAGLLHVLRLATKEAEAVDARARETLIVGPIEGALRAEAGAFASLDSPSLAPSPYEFQRVHCHAMNVRLSTVYVRSKALVRHHRLHRTDKPGAVAAASAAAAAIQSRSLLGSGQAPDVLRLAQKERELGAAASIADAAEARIGQVDVYLGSRSGTNPEDCAAAAIPFELEVIRAPALGVLDAVAASSVTLGAFQAAAAITPLLYQPNEDAYGDLRPYQAVSGVLAEVVEDDEEGRGGNGTRGQGESGAAAGSMGHATSSADFEMEKGQFPSHMASGGAPVAAPSAIPTVARAHASSATQLYADYTAHTEMILSPYTADTCGLHESDEIGIASVLGAATLFCYEHVQGMVPLSQLVQVCGRLPEGRPLFRHLASEVVLMLSDIEAQCTFSLAPGSITVDNIYLSEGGTRLTLRGVAWGDPIPPGQEGTDLMLAHRSITLMRTFGEVLRDIIVESNVTRHMEEDAKLVTEAEGEALAGSAEGGEEEEAAVRVAREARKEIEHSRRSIMKGANNGSGEASADSYSPPVSEEVRMFDRRGAELGVHVAEHTAIHIVLPNGPEDKDVTAANAGAAIEGGLSSSSSLFAGSTAAGSRSASSSSISSRRKLVWLPPVLQLAGAAPGDITGPAAAEAAALFSPGRTLNGAYTAGGLPAKVASKSVEPMPPSYNDELSGSDAPTERTRFVLHAKAPGELTVWFYLVDANSESAAAASLSRTDRRRGGNNGAAEILIGQLIEAGFSTVAPQGKDVVESVAVPLRVYGRSPSPTLSGLLEACDPRPEESAAVSTLKVLAAMRARMTGMVNGKKPGGASDGTGARKKGGAGGSNAAAGSGSSSSSAPAYDQTHDDQTFLVVMRQLAAVLRFNRGMSGDPSAAAANAALGLEDGGVGGGVGGDEDAYAVRGAEKANLLAVAANGGSAHDVSDVDALAALINAMEAVAEGEDGVVGPLAGTAARGGSAADADATALDRKMGHKAKKRVRWISHLARHPYFAEGRLTPSAVMDEYASFSHPLTNLAASLSRKAAGAAKMERVERAAAKMAAVSAASAESASALEDGFGGLMRAGGGSQVAKGKGSGAGPKR